MLLDKALVWLRRDLRVDDNAALYHALKGARQVWCCFVYDTLILDPLPRADRRVEFIHDSIGELHAALQALGGGGLLVRHGKPLEELPQLAAALGVQAVYCSHDDDPYARERDAQVRGRLADLGIALHTSKDHVVFERSEVLTQAGGAFGVFTPYKNAWLKKLDPFYLSAYPSQRLAAQPPALAPLPAGERLPTLEQMGFARTNLRELNLSGGAAAGNALLDDFIDRIDEYENARNFPAVKGPSYLSVHLRFGTVSVRRLAREAHARALAGVRGAEVWLSELIWRDFYNQVLHHHPHVATSAFKPAYDRIKWEHGKAADALHDAWCAGRTGYPIVDAAMVQMNTSGYMHNRLRMVAASFYIKDLGLDYKRGEAYFALHLNDYDLASNNGGWQWAASTGADPQPWFRTFNPVMQSQKFDAEGRFIRRYLPQLARLPDDLIHTPWLARPVDLQAAGVELVDGLPGPQQYPRPVIDREVTREKTKLRYAAIRDKDASVGANT